MPIRSFSSDFSGLTRRVLVRPGAVDRVMYGREWPIKVVWWLRFAMLVEIVEENWRGG